MTARFRVKATLLSASILATAMLGANPALAADAAPADAAATENDEAIIVTATRREASLSDVPINISAIGAKQLESQRLNDVRDLGAFVPGITITDSGPRGAGTIVMRGLSADDTSASADNRNNAIGTYLGEVPLYLDFKLIDLQRIEVLLGPQGTLYGLGTLAGAIRYIPERPDASKVSGYVHGRAYNVNNGNGISYVAHGAINLPIIPDLLAFRSATGYYFDTGFIDYPFTVKTLGVSTPQPGPVSNPAGTAQQQEANFNRQKDANFERTFTTRNQLGLTLPDFKAYVSYVYQQTKTNGRQANGGGVLGEGRYEGPWRVLEPTNRQSHLVSLEMEAQLADIATLVSSTAYTQTTNRAQGDVTDLLIDLDYAYDSWPQFTGFNQSTNKTTQINQELRLVSTHGGPFSWVLGGFFNQSKVANSYREYVPGYGASSVGINDGITPNADDNEYASAARSRTTEQAVFGELSFKVTPEWQFTGGLRYYGFDVINRGGTALPYFDGAVLSDDALLANTATAKKSGVVWKANTSYKLSDDVLIYATYSTGYRVGGANTGTGACKLPLDPTKQNVCALPNEVLFSPDKTKNIEIGIRAALFDKRLSFNLSLFQVKWDGIQLGGQTINGAVGITVNGGKASNRGVDFSFNANVTDRFALRGNYSYLDAKLSEDVIALLQVRDSLDSAFRNADRSKFSKLDVRAGDRLPGSAAHSGALSASYTLPMGDNKTIFDWTATYVGDILTRVGGRGAGEKLPGYVMNRASLTYQTPVYEISLFANNIFDKYAVTGVSNDLSRVGFAPSGTLSRFYARSVARPRVIGLEGRLKF